MEFYVPLWRGIEGEDELCDLESECVLTTCSSLLIHSFSIPVSCPPSDALVGICDPTPSGATAGTASPPEGDRF